MVNKNQPITPWQYSIDPVTGGAVATFNGQVVAPGMGGGNVTGPASAVADNLAAFNGTTGKLLKDSGVSAASFDLAGAATAALASANAYTDGITANFVDGPAGATDGNLAVFNGPTGLLIKDGGPAAAYAENTWSPSITNGGVTTGITYGTQLGQYITIGNLVIAWFFFSLTNKGSGGGDIVFKGFPFMSDGNIPNGYFPMACNNVTFADGPAYLFLGSNANQCFAWVHLGQLAQTTMDDSHITNTSSFMGYVIYRK